MSFSFIRSDSLVYLEVIIDCPYVQGPVLGTGNAAVNKTTQTPGIHSSRKEYKKTHCCFSISRKKSLCLTPLSLLASVLFLSTLSYSKTHQEMSIPTLSQSLSSHCFLQLTVLSRSPTIPDVAKSSGPFSGLLPLPAQLFLTQVLTPFSWGTFPSLLPGQHCLLDSLLSLLC